ncbi:hypothetical protein lerEdw1_009000 [Lerista edwardsae]|nr:hypothetical protein lerEdw1_009000 [Lerista edwardsae]
MIVMIFHDPPGHDIRPSFTWLQQGDCIMFLYALRPHDGNAACRIPCLSCRFWEEGKVLIFDDSFEHEVWQDANHYRLIFIVDVWHPELTQQQRRTLPAI